MAHRYRSERMELESVPGREAHRPAGSTSGSTSAAAANVKAVEAEYPELHADPSHGAALAAGGVWQLDLQTVTCASQSISG